MSLSGVTAGSKTKYKIVLLGDQYVGKTSIIDRFINDKFETSYNPTIGIDFLVRNIVHQNRTYRLQLWDTAGQERFQSMIPSYLKDSNCCIIVYDVTSLKSLEHVEKWNRLYHEHREELALSIMVGNKCDCEAIQCTAPLIDQVARKLNIENYMISAKSGEGVTGVFLSIIDLVTDKLNNTKIVEHLHDKIPEQQDFTSKICLAPEPNPQLKLGTETYVKVIKSPCC